MRLNMKKGIVLVIASMMSLVGCSTTQSMPDKVDTIGKVEATDKKEGSLTYSNLVDEKMQQQVLEKFLEVGITKQKGEMFLNWVRDYNTYIGEVKAFNQGFTTIDTKQVNYDDIIFETRYLENGMQQIEINCRLTAFLLFDDFFNIENPIKEADNYLMFDKEAFVTNPLCIFDEKQQEKFVTLFNPIQVEAGSKQDVHGEAILKEWEKRGITFKEDQKISLITLFLHDPYENKRLVGHVGVLLDTEEGLYFLEKYSSEYPFQYRTFNSEDEVVKYLLSRDDIYGDGTEEAPIIMKNDQILSY